jgi:glyoxylase-like metal-dependent hydrolase (beta-lactamase superfamily II)
MRLCILGCSGGIGGDLRTTSMLLDDDILIDAGTGVGDLSLQQLAKIDHIFVTHSHLDHVAAPAAGDGTCHPGDAGYPRRPSVQLEIVAGLPENPE